MNLKSIKASHLWYAIGLIATDGNLSKDKRHIIITSKDEDLLDSVKGALHLNCDISKKSRAKDVAKIYSVLQFSDVNFYRYLLGIGLTPRKSLNLGRIKVQDDYFIDFLRGVVDGDGSINKWANKANKGQQWSLRITSAAPLFAEWLKGEIEDRLGVVGKLYKYQYKYKKNPIYIIKFGKIATKIILKEIYYDDCLALFRKLKIAKECLRTDNGWVKYDTMVI